MAKRTFKASPSSSAVTCGLFGNRSKNKDNKNSSSSRPRTMQEYIDRANQVGNEFDQLQQKAVSKYSKPVNSSDAIEVIEYQNTLTGRTYSDDQLRQLFKFAELRGRFAGTYEDWVADKLNKGTLIECCEDGQTYSNSAIVANESAHESFEDDIQEIGQEFTSENTSINSGKLPAVFNMVKFEPGTVNIDYGGGRFDNVAEYLSQYDVINLVYDPYNRSKDHNQEVISIVREHGGADSATCSNVLNVIKESEVRLNVLSNIKKLVKPSGVVYITVYEGKGTGEGAPTKSGYQMNRKTADYLEEIQQVFPDATRRGKLIVCHPNGGAVNSATDMNVYHSNNQRVEELSYLIRKAVRRYIKSMGLNSELGFVVQDNIITIRVSGLADMADLSDYIEEVVPIECYAITPNRDTITVEIDTEVPCDEDVVCSDSIEDSSDSIEDLRTRLYTKVMELMQTVFGFSEEVGFTQGQVMQFFDVWVDEDYSDDEHIKMNVYAQLADASLLELAEQLTAMLANEEIYAPFEIEKPGRLSAYIPYNNVSASTAINGAYEYGMLPGPGDYDPPEYPDPETAEAYLDEMYLDLDCDILLYEDGSWEYVDNECTWAYVNPDGSDVYSTEYSFLKIGDTDTFVEDTDKLLETLLPEGQSGKYHISGKVTLVYDIYDVEYYSDYQGIDEDGDPIYETEYDEDSGKVSFAFGESKIENFKYVKVGNL